MTPSGTGASSPGSGSRSACSSTTLRIRLAEPVSEDAGMEYLTPCTRREAYAADITYGTNHEFGFDYLRDNMATDAACQVQREQHFAIVDEVDNILIDEARTPLIISGPPQETTSHLPALRRARAASPARDRLHGRRKARGDLLTEDGVDKVEKALNIDNIYAPENYRLTRYMEAALKAHILYQRDRDYVVKDGEVVIVDDFTGRLMFGRRWSDGLHQAVEAKEGVKIQQRVDHLRDDHAAELLPHLQQAGRHDRYGRHGGGGVRQDLQARRRGHPHEPADDPRRRGRPRLPTEREKFDAVVEEIEEMHATGQPVLVGTVSIEKSRVPLRPAQAPGASSTRC